MSPTGHIFSGPFIEELIHRINGLDPDLFEFLLPQRPYYPPGNYRPGRRAAGTVIEERNEVRFDEGIVKAHSSGDLPQGELTKLIKWVIDKFSKKVAAPKPGLESMSLSSIRRSNGAEFAPSSAEHDIYDAFESNEFNTKDFYESGSSGDDDPYTQELVATRAGAPDPEEWYDKSQVKLMDKEKKLIEHRKNFPKEGMAYDDIDRKRYPTHTHKPSVKQRLQSSKVDRAVVVGQIMIREITSEFNGMIPDPMNMRSKNLRNLSVPLVA